MNRELDAQLDARLMGACGDAGHEWETTPVVELGGYTFGGDVFCGKCGRERGLYMTPAYSTDLNACAQAEARVIGIGLGARYADALRDVVGPLIPAHGLSLITASAEARCRAMLQVVGEGA